MFPNTNVDIFPITTGVENAVLTAIPSSQNILQAYTKFNKETDDGVKMEKYNKLLGDAISTIIEVKEQSDIASLLDGNIDILKGTKIKGLDDFELIAFVVVK